MRTCFSAFLLGALLVLSACDAATPLPGTAPVPTRMETPTGVPARSVSPAASIPVPSTGTPPVVNAPTSTALPTSTSTSTRMPTPTPLPRSFPTATSVAPGNYRIVFARDKHLWSVDLDGKNVVRITPEGWTHEGFGFEQTTLSPDQQFLPIYNQAEGTWILTLEDLARFQVSRQGVYPRWAADSRAIVYSESGNIYVREFAQWDRPRRIAAGFIATWSPDGRWIAFLTDTAFEGRPATIRHLHLIHPDGTASQEFDSFEVGNRSSGSIDLTWSFDGHYLLAWGQKPQAARLWKIDNLGNRLTTMDAYNMAFAPTVPYLVLEDPTNEHGLQIFRLDADLQGRKAERCTWGTWAFDGSRLACVAESTDTRQSLRIVDLDSGQARVVSFALPPIFVIQWVPNTDFMLVSNANGLPALDDSESIWLIDLGQATPPRLIATRASQIAVIHAR